MQTRRAAKCLVALVCSLAALGMASAYSHMVNYRGQPQEDLTCMQAAVTTASTGCASQQIVYRNDPSTNCFGFPSLQFDTAPIEGGKPNGLTIDWSLMVDQLQMQDDDRIHFHLPGFTGGHNTFGIMGPAIDAGTEGNLYTPNFNSESTSGDLTTTISLRADFGALVGIWGISCGTEKNLYMDRAKVDNIRTAEWDPSREMLKFVLKAQRYAPATGRTDGYTGTRSAEYPSAESLTGWVSTASQGLAIPFSDTTTDPSADKDLYNYAAPANLIGATPVTSSASITINDQSLRGHHLQAMEYAFEGPRSSTMTNPSTYSHDTGVTGGTAAAVLANYKNDGYIYAPGNRVCGIYVDPTKLHRSQTASKITNGLGPLPPYGGIGKNWYKLAYMRRFINSQCAGGTILGTYYTRPGMNPETCTMVKTSQDLSKFWQVPFDGDTERVVGYQFTTTKQMLPVAKGAKPAGFLQTPTFSYAQAKGTTTGKGNDNCITVSLIPSVTFVSTTSKTSITIEGLTNSGSSDSDTFQLWSDSSCGSTFSTLVGSDGTATKNFQPVAGTAAKGSPDALLMNYRPFGRAAMLADGLKRARAITATGSQGTLLDLTTNIGGYGSDGYYDDVDWHTRARTGTTSALTTGNPNNNAVTASALKAATALASGKLVSTTGTLASANGMGKFEKVAGRLTVAVAPGYFLQAGELLVFSFKVQNPTAVQPTQALTVSATGTYCDSDNGFCDGVADKSLDIQKVPIVGKGKLLQSSLATFVTSTIYQSSSDPDDLTTIFVTLTSNLDLKKPDSTSDAKITISGLCGFETGTNVVLYQNQKAGGIPEDSVYPTEAIQTVSDFPGLSSEDTSILSSAATFTAGALEITLGTTGFVAETDYAFAFQMQTTKAANAACIPMISSSGGSESVLATAMTSTNVGLVVAPKFTTVKIGQVTTRPGVTNYLCVTLQHNYRFYTDAVVNQGVGSTGNYIESKITISGLTGTQAVNSAVLPLSYCPTEVAYFDDKTTQHTSTQFQPDVTDFSPKRYATFGTRSCFGDALLTQQCIPGNPFVPSDAFDPAAAGRSWFGTSALETKDTFTWDQASGTAVLTVDAAITRERVTNPQTVFGGIPKNSEIVFALPLQNGVATSECKVAQFEASGRIVQKAVMVQTMTGRAIQDGEVLGDACALKVYQPGFLLRRIVQSTSATGDDNVITVSLRSNVDLSSVANGQASYITISGLTGTASGSNANLAVLAPISRYSPKFEGNDGTWVQGTGTMTLKLDDGACVAPTVWSSGPYYDGSSTKTAPFSLGGAETSGASVVTSTANTVLVDSQTKYKTGGKLSTTMPSVCIKAGFLYVFSFQVTNPASEQAAPAVSITGKYRDTNNFEVAIAAMPMQGPISDDADKQAMLVSDQILTTYKIGQLIPAPGSINVICVTLTASKDIKSQPDAPLSSITFTGLVDFDASAQDLQMYENDGVTKIASCGGDPGSTSSDGTDSNYKVGAIFSSQNTASGSSTTTSGPGWANYDGATKGNVVVWIQGETAMSGVYKYMQKRVDHKFCFRLKNAKKEHACNDVSVVVNNKGTISRVKAEQDTSNTVEDYKFGSTCAGYVAAPNFVIKNWRSSSNNTESTAIIHMELATNILLETGDTITISGLTSYTKSCVSPPCDVGLDVTRTAVSTLYGKPYINGVRNVAGFGASDSGASATSRQTFAKAIQSLDISGLNAAALTSTFGTDASWGKLGDTQESASTLTLTIAKDAEMNPADISNQISTQNAPSEATLYEIVLTLKNKAAAVGEAPIISINIGKGQTQYVSLPMNAGQTAPSFAVTRVGDGGMQIAYTPMKTIYGGESLILTLPKFTRDSNGMLFGVTSSPNNAFGTYASMIDWKSYGTEQEYARAFFTNGFVADGYHAKSGDSGQTGERWNYPNINAKVTTDADYNHDTGIFVLDINDPGVGLNKNYWYAANEDNLYEGRVTRAANDGASVANYVSATLPARAEISSTLPAIVTPAAETTLLTAVSPFAGSSATVDYYLDNGEDLLPVRAWTRINEYVFSSSLDTNNFKRAVAIVPLSTTASTTPSSGYVRNLNSFNSYPGPVAATITAIANNIVGTPPFIGIPSKYQPSKRDNFYKGMLMKCWVGTKAVGGRVPWAENLGAGAHGYRAATTVQKELLPPPEQAPLSTFGKNVLYAAATNFADAQLDVLSTAPFGIQQAAMTTTLTADAKVMSKADVSRALETRVIQASYRQIDYVPRVGGGCFVSGAVTTRTRFSTNAVTTITVATSSVAAIYATIITVQDAITLVVGQQLMFPDGSVRTVTVVTSTTVFTVDGPYLPVYAVATAPFTAGTWIIALDMMTQSATGAVGCQDEVPGYPAVVRLEGPFSRPLDPDALCYIQRKADVGVYTGMTAMIGNLEYSIKQGAANIYTVGFAADALTGPNGDPVDRMVPRSYSTEGSGFGTAGKRTTAFFADGVGLSGQPYTIYSQLELVAKKGSRVSVGETVTITIPSAAGISPPAGGLSAMSGLVTPANTKKTLADKVKLSHVLLVPLSPACSVVAGYGVASGCQEGNGMGGVFDLILSDKWPYAYSVDNKNDLNGYSMTVFGGQATVIKTMADKYSQDLPYKPLQGLNTAETTITTGVFTDDAILSVVADTYSQLSAAGDMGGRAQKGVVSNLAATNKVLLTALAGSTTANTAMTAAIAGAATGGPNNANSVIESTFTVARELDLLTLTTGTLRADAQKMPKLPNSPVTVTDSACGYKQADTLGPSTLPYAVCLSLGDGSLAHSQGLNVGGSVGSSMDEACASGGRYCVGSAFTTGGVVTDVAAVAVGIPAFVTDVPGAGATAAVTVTSSSSLSAGMTVSFYLQTTNALVTIGTITSIASNVLTVNKVWPLAAVTVAAAAVHNVYIMPDVPTYIDAVRLSLTAPVLFGVGDTTHLRQGMNVKIFDNTFTLKAIARVNSITSITGVYLTQVYPRHVKAAILAITDIVVPLADGPRMGAEGTIIDGVQTITGAVGQEATPSYPHDLRDLYSNMGSARPVPNYGTTLGRYEDAADNLGLGAYIVVGVYINGTSDRFVHAQQGNKGTTKSALPVASDMANNLVIQRYIGTSRTTIPLANVPSGYIGGNNVNKPSGGFPAAAGQVPRYQARVAAGYAIGRFSYGVDNIMQVRSDMTSGAPATGTTIPQASMLPGNNNMDGALAMSPWSRSVDLSASDGLRVSVLAANTANALSILPLEAVAVETLSAAHSTATALTSTGILIIASTDATAANAASSVASSTTEGNYYQIVQTGEIILVTAATGVIVGGVSSLTVVRGALGSRAMAIPALATVRKVGRTAGVGNPVVGQVNGIADFDSTANEQTVGTTFGVAADLQVSGAISMVNNKHPSGHSVDVTAPTTMQKIRFGRSTLPLPQVFHTGVHQAVAVGQANLLTRGTCGLDGAIPITFLSATGVNTLPRMSSTTGGDEMCRTIPSQQYNVGLPYSRNTYIEQGMDVYLVSSVFDSLIQRPEPLRKTALGLTEEGRTQNYPGTGAFAGGPVTLTETTIPSASSVVAGSASTAIVLTGTTISGTQALRVGDIIHFDAAGTAHESVMATEAMLVTGITSDLLITVQRGFLGSLVAAITLGEVIFVRNTNGGFPGLSVSSDANLIPYVGGSRPSAVSPVRHTRTVGVGVHGFASTSAATLSQRNDQILGNIQTTGMRMPRGGPISGAPTTSTTTGTINAKGMVLTQDVGFNPEAYNYGFDSDFRLYSVLGPFMRPAVIRDVIDTSKLSRSVLSSRFPGVTTIHNYGRAEDLIWSGIILPALTVIQTTITGMSGSSALLVLKVGDYITAPTVLTASATVSVASVAADAFLSGEIMLVTKLVSGTAINVQRGVLGTTAVQGIVGGNIFIIPSEDRNNNVKYSLAPIKGTTFATAQTRKTQYHTYTETDRIISFCNPMQSDLNNAPGAVIMSAITDDAVLLYTNATSTSVIPDRYTTSHTLTGSSVFTNPLVLGKWRNSGATFPLTDVTFPTSMITGTTVIAITTANVGDYIMAVKATVTATTTAAAEPVMPRGEIMRILSIAGGTITVARAQFGTTAVITEAADLIYVLPRSEVSRIITETSGKDSKFASSNGKASTAPSLWTVPRRHHLCRKLVTGAPELATSDVVADLYRVANFVARKATAGVADAENNENDQYARSRYTESIRMSTVLNQDPSPNMRAMVTFVEPTKISVSFDNTPVCTFTGSFDASKVDTRCTSVEVKGETSTVVLPGGLPSWFTISIEEIAYASFPEFNTATLRRATVSELIATGISSGDQKKGLNIYDKGMCLGNFIKITVPARNTEVDGVTFTIKQSAIRDGTLTNIDTGLNNGSRRLLATCPTGFDARLIKLGEALSTACNCDKACGVTEATCSTKSGGTWNTVNLLERVCRTATASPYDYTGAIVGGVLGGFFGLLLIGLLVWYLCCRKPEAEPVGRPTAMASADKPLAPVYLPQQYPSLPEQYMPAPMPAYPEVYASRDIVQPTGQPMLYSSYQGVPVMEAYPSQPGAYPAPYGVVPQPVMYGQPEPFGMMTQQQPIYGQPAYGI